MYRIEYSWREKCGPAIKIEEREDETRTIELIAELLARKEVPQYNTIWEEQDKTLEIMSITFYTEKSLYVNEFLNKTEVISAKNTKIAKLRSENKISKIKLLETEIKQQKTHLLNNELELAKLKRTEK